MCRPCGGPYVIRRGAASSSVRVDTPFARRVDCPPARMSRVPISYRGGASNDDEDDPPPSMRCAHPGRCIREICAHLT